MGAITPFEVPSGEEQALAVEQEQVAAAPAAAAPTVQQTPVPGVVASAAEAAAPAVLEAPAVEAAAPTALAAPAPALAESKQAPTEVERKNSLDLRQLHDEYGEDCAFQLLMLEDSPFVQYCQSQDGTSANVTELARLVEVKCFEYMDATSAFIEESGANMTLPALQRIKNVLDACYAGRTAEAISAIEDGVIQAAVRYMEKHPVYQRGGPELPIETCETWVDLLFFPPSRRKTLTGRDLKMGVTMAIGTATRLAPQFKEAMASLFADLGVAETLLAGPKVPAHPDGGYDVSLVSAIQAAEARVRIKVVEVLCPELAARLHAGELDMASDVEKIFDAVIESIGGENVKMEVSDLLRCLARFESGEEVVRAVALLRERFEVTRVVNKMSTPLRQVMINFKFEGGVAEAQLVFTGAALAPGSTEYLLWKWGHVAYEIARAKGRVKAVLEEKESDAAFKQWAGFRVPGGGAASSVDGLLTALGGDAAALVKARV